MLESAGHRGHGFLLRRVRRVSVGGTFRVRPLHFNTVPSILADQKVRRSNKSVYFRSLDEIVLNCQNGTWDIMNDTFVPMSSNVAAVDLIGPGLTLYQSTISRKHGLKVTSGRSANESLLAIASMLMPLLPDRWSLHRQYLDLYLVVPFGNGATYSAQTLEWFVPRIGTKSANRTEPWPAKVTDLVIFDIVSACGGGSNHGFHVKSLDFAGVDKTVEIRQHVLECDENLFKLWLSEPMRLGGLEDSNNCG